MTETDTTVIDAPGTYRLWVGDLFYIGSTFSLQKRWLDHRWRLREGKHHVPRLQRAFDSGGEDGLRFEVVEVIDRKPYEEDEKLKRRLQLHEQWMLDAEFEKSGCCNASADSGFNTRIGEWLKRQWEDPEFCERQVKRLRARRGEAVSAESREKMAAAKRGARNVRSRACWLELGGKRREFACVSDAARWLRVKQQVLDLWIRGKVPWPGSGQRAPRRRDLEGLRGGFVS